MPLRVGLASHFLSVYFFSIDPQHFVDGSTSSPGYSVIGENPGLFKFWSLSRSFQIIISIPEFKSPRRLPVSGGSWSTTAA